MNQNHRAYIVEAINKGASKAKRAGWPGMPMSQFPVTVQATLREMIRSGELAQHRHASRNLHYVSIAAR